MLELSCGKGWEHVNHLIILVCENRGLSLRATGYYVKCNSRIKILESVLLSKWLALHSIEGESHSNPIANIKSFEYKGSLR